MQRELLVQGIASQGDGVATLEGRPIFVAGTAPGDRIVVEVAFDSKGNACATLVTVVDKGWARVQPPCPHFGVCGGCTLQHVSTDAYRVWLRHRVETALAHHGLQAGHFEEAHVSPPGARRRLSLRVLRTPTGVVLGFNRKHSHDVVDVTACPVADDSLVAVLPAWREALASLFVGVSQYRLDLSKTAVGAVAVLHLPEPLRGEERRHLAAAAMNMKLARLSVMVDGACDTVAQSHPPFITVDGLRLDVPEASFLQATVDGEAVMVDWLKSQWPSARRVLDLFCGVGTFSLPMAKTAQVWAVDGDPRLLEAVARSARHARRLKPVNTVHRDLYRHPFSASELNAFDCVVFDPPRAGAQGQVLEIARSELGRVLAVSCNPNTFARDAQMLVEGGFRLSTVKPIGQFLWSSHVELVARFER